MTVDSVEQLSLSLTGSTTHPKPMSTPQRLHTPSKSPRETPRCATCKQPRKGHPRSGCPALETPTPRRPLPTSNRSSPYGTPVGPRRTNISLDNKAEKRRRRSSFKPPCDAELTLASLSTDAHEALDRMQVPGIFEDARDDKEVEAMVIQWQETMRKPKKHRYSSSSSYTPQAELTSSRGTPSEDHSGTPRPS